MEQLQHGRLVCEFGGWRDKRCRDCDASPGALDVVVQDTHYHVAVVLAVTCHSCRTAGAFRFRAEDILGNGTALFPTLAEMQLGNPDAVDGLRLGFQLEGREDLTCKKGHPIHPFLRFKYCVTGKVPSGPRCKGKNKKPSFTANCPDCQAEGKRYTHNFACGKFRTPKDGDTLAERE